MLLQWQAQKTQTKLSELDGRMIRGESMISDIICSNRLQGYYFALGEPAIRKGVTFGTLSCTMPASELLQHTPLSDKTESISLRFSDYMSSLGVREGSLDELISTFSTGEGMTTGVYIGEDDYAVASVSLGYNGWSLVQLIPIGVLSGVSRQMTIATELVSLAVLAMGLLLAYICMSPSAISGAELRSTISVTP